MTAPTLVEFLRARLGEDEADHYPYHPSDWGDFKTPASGCVACGVPANAQGRQCRVLADIDAKRRIVADMLTLSSQSSQDGDARSVMETCSERVLRHLASVYRDHPDYDERWAV